MKKLIQVSAIVSVVSLACAGTVLADSKKKDNTPVDDVVEVVKTVVMIPVNVVKEITK